MATMRMKTMYLEHLHPSPNFQDQKVLPCQHISRQFLYGTMQVFDDPTIIAWKYTNHGYFPSNVNTCAQICQEQNEPYHGNVVIVSLLLLKVSYPQTIGSINRLRQQHRFIQYVSFLEIVDTGFSTGKAFHSFMFTGIIIHGPIFMHDKDTLQLMAITHFEVIWIMSRCDFDSV